MIPREKLTELQRESKPSKFSNKPVYACPVCWFSLSIIKKPKVTKTCARCLTKVPQGKIEIFDSLAEHSRGLELQMLKQGGVITDLEHHEKFKLAPKLYYYQEVMQIYGSCREENAHDDRIQIEIPHKFKEWESDYTYQMKGEKAVEEVKRLGTKKITKKHQNKNTGEVINIKFKIPWPYFADPETEFRKKCQLMLAIHGHRVQVRAGGTLWVYDEEWKLKEVKV